MAANLASAPSPLLGRGPELARLRAALRHRGPRLIVVTGPRGRGKTAVVRQALSGRRAIHLETCELTEAELLQDFQSIAHATLGEAPTPQRPGVLPMASGLGGWLSVLMGIVDRTEGGRPLALALDGMEALLGARRKLGGVIAEAFQSARSRSISLRLILTARDPRTLAALVGPQGALGPADLELALPALPFRTAGWGHGGRDALDAFRRWAVFGDDPAHLPKGLKAGGLEASVIGRVLVPGGDLFDAPLGRLERTFQRPARYAAVLRALARGPLSWSGTLEKARGIDSGGQLAPYLRRLEEEGLVRVDLPLDASPHSRTRRYALADPFLAFWFGWVLPHRSLLSTMGAETVWRHHIGPTLEGHYQSWMEEIARRWLRDHAEEAFGAQAREAGALWGAEAEFPVAGRLANGQVCFGLAEWSPAGRDLARDMGERMKASRYGIGREARTPIFFLAGEGDEAVRRMVARVPYASVVDLADVMGPPPGAG